MRIQTSVFSTIFLVLCLGCATAKTQVKLIQPEHDASTYRRLTNLGMVVARVMDGASPDFKYGILDGENVNAMVDVPHKALLVTKGLMNYFNDKELLCVLAHEWAHVTHGDYGKRADAADAIDALSTLVAFVVPGGILASAIINPVAKKSFSRTQEEKADAEAAKVLHDRLRISPYACISALQKLRGYVERTGGCEGGGLLDSHPSIGARIAKLKELWPDKPRVYSVSQIIVRSAEEARAIAIRLNAGEAFAYLASTFSTDALAKVNRGEMGLFEEWELNPEIVGALKKRRGKELIVFRSPAGFNILKAIEIEPRYLHPATPGAEESRTHGQ